MHTTSSNMNIYYCRGLGNKHSATTAPYPYLRVIPRLSSYTQEHRIKQVLLKSHYVYASNLGNTAVNFIHLLVKVCQ